MTRNLGILPVLASFRIPQYPATTSRPETSSLVLPPEHRRTLLELKPNNSAVRLNSGAATITILCGELKKFYSSNAVRNSLRSTCFHFDKVSRNWAGCPWSHSTTLLVMSVTIAFLYTLKEVQKFQIKFWHSKNSDRGFNMVTYRWDFFLLCWTVQRN